MGIKSTVSQETEELNQEQDGKNNRISDSTSDILEVDFPPIFTSDLYVKKCLVIINNC